MPSNSKTTNSLDACNPALNATVSASAGSGKTWLLITRIVRLLIDGAEPGNIIALTFTRKAAAEMQIRLNERLFAMAVANEVELGEQLGIIGCSNNTENRHISAGLYEKLMRSLYPVRIQTFHSFCQDILSRFPLEADISPGFELLEDSSLLERQAWQTLFDEARLSSSTKDPLRLNNALDAIMQFCNGPDNTQTSLRSFLNHRSDWWAYTANTKDPVSFACASLTRFLQIDQQFIDGSSNPITHFFNDSTRLDLMVFANLLREIKNKTSEKHADIIDDALSNTANHSEQTRYSLIRSAFIKQDGEVLVQGRKHSAALEKKLGPENTEKFLDLHHAIANTIQQLNEQLNRLLTLEINQAWYFSGNRYIEIYQQLKKEMRLLDFTDLEWKCYQLLQHADNAHWVQYKIDQRIDHILIDEFQDTNPTQWHLLSPILEEIAANPDQRPRSVFLVGDEKQSIYSFRRANPALQAQASLWLKDNLTAKATPLDFSRRSSNAIIHCVNHIFEQPDIQSVMTGFTSHGTHLNELPGKVQLNDLFQADEEIAEDTTDASATDLSALVFRDPLEQPRENNVRTLRHEEAEYISKQILHLVNSTEKITENGCVRPIAFGDIMILMRNRTHIAIYEEALKQQGIPFVGNKKGGLLDNLEIQDLNCLLNILVTPYNNIALAQVLKSPVFSASDDDLITLARFQTNQNKKETHWYNRLLLLAEENQKQLSRPLQRAAQLLPHWQQLADRLPVHDCLDKIFSEGNIIKRYMAANRPENRQKVAANCQRFLTLSLETDSGRYPGITRFLQRLNHLQNYSASPPEEPLTQSEESRVRLMTIHGSKGLEAPVVFLADCNSTASNKNAYASLVRWPANKAQPVNFQLQLSKDYTDQMTQQLQQEKLNEQQREELNLLYVALTRAREQLYISGVANSRTRENSWYQIIANGLADITQREKAIDNIDCCVYRHLDYTPTTVDSAKSNIKKTEAVIDNKDDIDERLLKPITRVKPSRFLIAPSLFTEDSFKNKDEDEKGGETSSRVPNDNIYQREIAKWRGITIHRVIEHLCNNRSYPATESSILQIQNEVTAETSLNNPAFILQVDGCVQEAVTTYNHADFEDLFNTETNRQTYNEMPLMYVQAQQAVYGVVDRVIKQDKNKTITVLDYKSHQLNAGESAKDSALQFTVQLEYYRSGIEKLWPKHDIKMGVLFTHHNQIVWSDTE